MPDTKLKAELRADLTCISRNGADLLMSDCDGGSELPAARELLTASLLSCIAASLKPLFARHEYPPGNFSAVARIAGDFTHTAINIEIHLPRATKSLLARCQRAAENCAISKALALPPIFNWNTHD